MPPPGPYRESNPDPELPLTPAFDRLASALADRYSPEHELGGGGMARLIFGRQLGGDVHRDIELENILLQDGHR